MKKPTPVRPLRARPSVPSAPRSAAWVRDDRGSLFLAVVIWVLIVFLLVPSPEYYLRGGIENLDTSASPVSRLIKLSLLGASTVIVLWRGTLAWLVLGSLNRFFTMFLLLVPLSILWSIDASATIARYVSLMSVVLVCFAFVAMSWHPRRFQNVLRPLLTALVVASLIFGLLFPDVAIEVGEGTLKNAWRGLTTQKNEFGMLGSFTFILWLHAWLSGESRWWFALIGCVLGGLSVLLSRSSTSLMSTLLATVFMLMLMRAPQNLRRYMPYIVGLFATIVVIYAVAVLNLVPGLSVLLAPVAAITGKDLTFSNRSEIWVIIKEHIQLRPLLGSGYGAYWTGPVPSSASFVFLGRMHFYPTESHNGYLEIVNDLGFLGLICLLGYLIVFIRQSLALMRLDRSQGVLFLGFFFQQAMANLSESCWLAVNALFPFTIMTLATFTVARSLLDGRLRLQFGAPVPPVSVRTQRSI